MTIKELKEILENFDPLLEVHLAVKEYETPLDYITSNVDTINSKDLSTISGKVIFHG